VFGKSNPGRIVILGAGPTGLGAAYRLIELGYTDFIVVEKANAVGGLAASFRDEKGFWWDLGGHVQFSHYSYYDEVLDALIPEDEWVWHERESWIRTMDRFVPYPFQNNIHRLPEDERNRVLEGLREAEAVRGARQKPENFREWITCSFGSGMAEIFMLPYNRKVWAWPLEEMSCQWIGERVAVPDRKRIEANILNGRDDVSWGPNNRFRFPLYGGTGAIWSAVARRIPGEHFLFEHEAIDVDADGGVLRTDRGRMEEFDSLVSTMPLDLLVSRTSPLKEEVKAAAQKLCHSSTHVLGFGLRGGKPQAMRTKCWMYFPESNSPYYRVTVFSNYSPNNVPEGEHLWSLMAEVSESPHKDMDGQDLREWTWRAMRQDGLVGADTEVVSAVHRRLEYGYPIPFRGRDAVLDTIMPELAAKHIYSRGRFGGWKYEVGNQDHSFMQGVEIANRLVLGETETTFFDPDRVNSMSSAHMNSPALPANQRP